MKKELFLLVCSIAVTEAFCCTSLLVGRSASTDGSTMITYAADSHTLYGELYDHPAADYGNNAILDIKEWDSGKPLGSIPQVPHTYAVKGNMNEHQVAITESTWGGHEELVDTTGVMDYGSLIKVALQRSRTAREAITVMTNLVKRYGYYSSGESFSIADPYEIWVMEMIGKGIGNRGAVWVAMRIPDDCIAAHANHPRIHTFPLDDKENCMYSADVISFAREKGYFTGLNKDFSFANAYAPVDFGALRGCEARVWSFFNKFSSDMASYLPYLKGTSTYPIPLYIKPNRKLSVQDIKNCMRDHFEDTPFDMTKDVGAGPFGSPYRYRPMNFTVDSVTYVNERAIATQQTGFSLVAQMRSWLPDPIGGVLWFGVDDANTSIYVPIYCAITEVPECFKVGNGDMYNFSWTSAFWIHNWVANMAYNRYSQMIPDIRAVQTQIEERFNTLQPSIDKIAVDLHKQDPQEAIRFLTDFSVTQAQTVTEQWKSLGEFLLVKFIDGNVKRQKDGKFELNPYGLPVTPHFPGYNEEYYRAIVRDAGDRLKVTF